MSKKILILAISSTLLQIFRLIFVYGHIEAFWLTSTIIIFSFIAIPSSFYLAFKNIKSLPRKNNLLNLLGLFFTFPTIFMAIFTYQTIFFEDSQRSVEIDPSTITVSDEKGNKLPIDSFSIITEKDSNNNGNIKFKRKKE